MLMNKRTLLIGLAVASFCTAQQATAQLTNEAWYHLGEVADYYADSTTNSRRIGSAYSHVPWNNPAYGGNFSGIITPTGVGGPLGTSGYTSSASLRAGRFGTMICTMWNAAGYAPPIKDWFVEITVQPWGKGYVWGSSGAWILTVNSSRGLGVRVWDDGNQQYYVGTILESPNVDVGNPVPIDTNSWTHLAMVNDNGNVTFYVNGVANGTIPGGAVSAPAGDLQFGRDNAGFDGLMDEARVCTFAPGTFTTNYFLLPPPGPQIVGQPQDASAWDGGATPFTVSPVINPALTYQWRRNDANVAGGNAATLYLPQVATANSGEKYACVLSANSLSVTSATATLTVVTPNAADVNAYRDAVMAEPSLLAYFPVDDCLGTTVTNRKDAAKSGTWEVGITPTYDGRTNRAFGQRALMFNLNGNVQIPAEGAYDFSSGNGTIEALIYLDAGVPFDATVFAVGWDGQGTNYAVQASSDGSSIVCMNDTAGRLSWPAPQSLIGRKAHLAVVYSYTTNITVYLDGQSLGTKQQTGFGGAGMAPAWIGSIGASTMNRWAGAIDELSIYGTALSESTVQTHYSRYVYGTNVAAPSIVSQPGSKTLSAGAAPILSVKAAGTLPLSYLWKSNNVAIPGATSPLWTVVSTAGVASTATYTLSVVNSFGSVDSAPIVLTFVPATDAYPQAVLKDRPSSYWRLGETSGTLAADVAGFNDATYTGPLTLGQEGAISGDPNTAVLFSASGSAAEAPYTPTLNPTTPFSVEFFAKPSQSGQIQRCVIGSQNRDVGRSGYAIYQGLNGNFWEVHMGDASTVQIWLYGKDPVVAGQWYHVVLVYTPADTTAAARIYVNGLDNTDYVNSDLAGNFLANNSKPFDIGSRMGLGVPYNGTVDEVAWYNYALSPAQIKSHMSAGVPLKLNISKAANVVADSKPSGTPFNGLNNGATWAASDTGHNGVMRFVDTATTQVTVPTSTSFDGNTGTIMFWMRSAGAVGTGSEGAMIFDRRINGVGYVFVLADDGTLFLQSNPTAANSFYSATAIADNAWHHIAISYDNQVGGNVLLYIDGALNQISPNASAWSWPVGQQIELGLSHDVYWKKYNGLLDDVRLYNRILTDAEVTQAFGGNVVDANALIGRYNFDAAPTDGFRVGWSPSYGALQWSTSVTGSFTDLTGASNPYLVAPAGPQLYFRGKTSQ
jgi:hypothetical protein